MDNYNAALEWAKSTSEISAKNIRANAPGLSRKEARDLILKLQDNGVISEPDEDGNRTLLNGFSPLQNPIITDMLAITGKVITDFVESSTHENVSKTFE